MGMRVKTIEILKKAKQEKKAVGAFNVTSFESLQAIVGAAKDSGHSCIVQATVKTLDYFGDKVLGGMAALVAEHNSNGTSIGFHLDHGSSLDEVIRAIDLGMDSVMIDASKKDFKENLRITRQVVEYAHSKGVSVQGELGSVPYLGREEQDIDWDKYMTDPEEAEKLVKESGIDALAVGIGNAHGFFRERETPDWERLEKINALLCDVPFILHGASDWNGEKIDQAIERGITCFNVDTDLRVAFITSLRESLSGKYGLIDPREFLAKAGKKVKEKVEEKMKIFALEKK